MQPLSQEELWQQYDRALEAHARQTEAIEARERQLEAQRAAAAPDEYRPSRSPPAHLLQGQPRTPRAAIPTELHDAGIFGLMYRMRQSVWPSQPTSRDERRAGAAAAAAEASDSDSDSDSS